MASELTIETANVRVDAEYIHERDEVIEPGRYVLLAVSDTGHGIPADNRRFATNQVDRSRCLRFHSA